jgi:hypothetical protein
MRTVQAPCPADRQALVYELVEHHPQAQAAAIVRLRKRTQRLHTSAMNIKIYWGLEKVLLIESPVA